MINERRNITAIPAGLDFFVSDLPAFYAAGNRDMLLVIKIPGEDGEREAEVAKFVETHRLILMNRNIDGDASSPFDLEHWVFIAEGLRHDEEQDVFDRLVAPLVKASRRSDARWTKAQLTGRA